MFCNNFNNGKISCDLSRPGDSVMTKDMIALQDEALQNIYENNSYIRQFLILFEMMTLKIFRNRTALYLQFATFIICGTFIGLLYYHAANDGSRMFDHLKLCWASTICTAYAQFMIPVLSCRLMTSCLIIIIQIFNLSNINFFFCI